MTEQERTDGPAADRRRAAGSGGRRWPTSPTTSGCPGRWSRSCSGASRGRPRRLGSGCSRQPPSSATGPDSLAQGLRRNRSRNLGVLFALRRPFEVELVEHMYPVARQLGYDLLLGPFMPARGQDTVVDELLRYRCAGLIVVGPDLHARDLEPLAEEVAVVEVGRGVTRGPVDVIRNDDAVGTRAGRRPPDRARTPRHRLHRRRREPRSGGPAGRLPRGDDRPRSGPRTSTSCPAATPRTRARTPPDACWRSRLPTAVIAANDLSPIGVLDIVLRAGVEVPRDLSVVGYDDSRFARLPGIDLTSVRQDIPKMAQLAVKAVVERLDRPTRKPKDVALRPKLVVRGTTSPPRVD